MGNSIIFAEIAALSGDPARASMLHALMDGGALTASMLARVAGISPQTASGHLNRLTSVGLLSVEKQGRHRYHRLASPSVARMLESIMQVAAELEPDHARTDIDPKHVALRKARTCYDHFAGNLGVALTDGLVAQGHVELTSEAGLLTDTGVKFLEEIGLDVGPMMAPSTRRSRRVLCRPCFDWSERRADLGGAVGAAIIVHSLHQGWIRRLEGTRALLITPNGRRVYRETFRAKID
jgi:DNA-binding transcriptional ArsR family regulator